MHLTHLRPTSLTAATVLAGVLLTSCGGADLGTPSAARPAGDAEAVDTARGAVHAMGDDAAPDAFEESMGPAGDDEHEQDGQGAGALAVTSSALVEVDDPRAVVAQLVALVEDAGGHLQAQQVVNIRDGARLPTVPYDHHDDAVDVMVPHVPGGLWQVPADLRQRIPDGATVVTAALRVPADHLDDASQLLADAAIIVHDESVQATDVSDQLFDVAARLRTLRQAERELSGLFESARETTGRQRVEEVAYLLEQLRPVREQIERLEASHAQLQGRVELSTYSVVLLPELDAAAEDVASVPGEFTPQDTAQRAVASLGRFGAAVLDWAIWAAVWAVPVVPLMVAAVALRRRRRRRADRGQDAQPAPDAARTAGTVADAEGEAHEPQG